VVGHASPLAQHEAKASGRAHAKETERVADHSTRVEAKHLAGVADAEAAIAAYEGRGPGRRGRRPHRWRSHVLRYRVEAFTPPSAGGGDGRRKTRHVEKPSALASEEKQSPWNGRKRTTGGPSWPPL
jgi:hypothetical protein